MITEFLKYILIHNCDLSQSALVRTFCGFDKDSQIKDKEYLKRVLEHYEAASKPRYIGELSLSKNKLMFAPTCNAEKLVSNTQVLLTDIDSAY